MLEVCIFNSPLDTLSTLPSHSITRQIETKFHKTLVLLVLHVDLNADAYEKKMTEEFCQWR